MKIHLNLTEDHLKLIRFFKLEDINDEWVGVNKERMLTLQTHLLDDVSLILGLRDKAIQNTSEDADGIAFPDDVEKYMLETYKYVSRNLLYIESLIHQMVCEGVKAGHYVCSDRDMVWTKVE